MKTLVIGYGNPLRSDDGAGITAAQEIERFHLPDVEVWTLQQLHVDLAEDLAGFDRIIFVDAAEPDAGTGLSKLEPSETGALSSSHFLGPEILGSLTKKIYGRCPELYTCAVRGKDLVLETSFRKNAVSRSLWPCKQF